MKMFKMLYRFNLALQIKNSCFKPKLKAIDYNYIFLSLLMGKSRLSNRKPYHPKVKQQQGTQSRVYKRQQMSSPNKIPKHKYIKKEINPEGDSKLAKDQAKQTVKREKEPNQKLRIKKKKKNRIIIRNLVVDVNEKMLRKWLNPFGQILQIEIPEHPDKKCKKGFAFVQFKSKNQCHKVIKELNKTEWKGRTVAIDFSVSKQDYQSALAMKDLNKEQEQKSDNQDVKHEQQDKQEQQQQQDQQAEQQQDQLQVASEKSQKQAKKQDMSSTIFVRNLPSSVDDKQLLQFFKKHGKVHYAKVVFDKQTKISKCTGFVKFADGTVAHQLIQYSRGYQLSLSKKLFHFKINPQINLEIQGKIIKIFSAESRQKIGNILSSRQEEDKSTDKKLKPMKKIKKLEDIVSYDKHNKRNLSLALLGMWRAEQSMNKEQYETFRNHQKAKIEKLKNPNRFVSKTRIVLKQLNKSITQQQIKQSIYQFLRQSDYHPKSLTYCKLMLDQSMKKSAGYAFVEFDKHEKAVKFLQYLSQNPNRMANMKTNYICQFAIQDARKVQKLGKKIHKIKGTKVQEKKHYKKDNRA